MFHSIGCNGTPNRALATTLHVQPLAKGSTKEGEPVLPGDIRYVLVFIANSGNCSPISRLRNADGETFNDFSRGLQSQIPLIPPYSKQFFAATMQFTNADLKPYTRISFDSCLHLGHIRNMMVSRSIRINFALFSL